jgi:hypothetical protein
MSTARDNFSLDSNYRYAVYTSYLWHAEGSACPAQSKDGTRNVILALISSIFLAAQMFRNPSSMLSEKIRIRQLDIVSAQCDQSGCFTHVVLDIDQNTITLRAKYLIFQGVPCALTPCA